MSLFNRFSNFIYQIKDNIMNHFFDIPGMLVQWGFDKIDDIKDAFNAYFNFLINKFAHHWPVTYFLSQETKNNFLWCEIGNRDLKKAQIFIDAGADVNFSHASDPNKTVLRLAFDTMDIYIIKALLKAGANAKDEQLLHQAIYHNDIDLLNIAIAAGANVNIKVYPAENTTALMAATQLMNIDMVKALIKAGANVMKTKCVAGRFITMMDILFAAPQRTYSNADIQNEIGICLLDAMTPEHIQFTFNQPAYNDSPEATMQKNLTKLFIMRHQIRHFQNDLLTQVFDSSSVDQKDKIFTQLNTAPIELLPQFFSKKYPLFTPEIAHEITKQTYAEYSKDKKLSCQRKLASSMP